MKKMRKESMKWENTFPSWIRTHDLWDSGVPLTTPSNVIFERGFISLKQGQRKLCFYLKLNAENSKNLNNCQIEFWDEKSPKH